MTAPQKTQVKICGVTAAADMVAASEAGASFLGFNFYPDSPRYLTYERAAQLARAAPPHLLRCAVVVDADDATIDQVIGATNPHYLQLHGDESPERAAALKQRVLPMIIKAIGADSEAALQRAEDYKSAADMLLFDSGGGGGSGTKFDWRWLARYRPPLPWLLAGGLTAANVAEALGSSGARMLDVSSGVERTLGQKSATAIRDFLDAVAAAEQR